VKQFIVSLFVIAVLAMPASAQGVNVVTSIKPVHALVAGVMGEVGTPYLLVDGNASPHSYALKPSGAQALEKADLVFWIGPELEAFLAGPLDVLGSDATSIALSKAQGITTLSPREGGDFDAHEHDDEEFGGEHEEIDMHIWLDPDNAKAMVHEIAAALIAADPANSSAYTANVAKIEGELTILKAEITAILSPVQGTPFVVFHDAYQYFENRFGMIAAGSITVSPEAIPGVRRIEQIREKIEKLGATCVFAEPQFTPKLVSVVTEGTSAKLGELDPMGSEMESGPDLYFKLIRALANSMQFCLVN